jgi:dynein heavy chain
MLQDKIAESLKEITNYEWRLSVKKKDYALLTRRATKLFFLVAGFNKISPMYQFTHQWFFGVFLDVLKNEMKDKTLEDLKREEGAFEKIMERFTFTFFQMVGQQIFEKDKQLFSFLLAYK